MTRRATATRWPGAASRRRRARPRRRAPPSRAPRRPRARARPRLRPPGRGSGVTSTSTRLPRVISSGRAEGDDLRDALARGRPAGRAAQAAVRARDDAGAQVGAGGDVDGRLRARHLARVGDGALGSEAPRHPPQREIARARIVEPARDRLARDDHGHELADAPRQRRLAPGDARRGQPAEHEREAAEQQRAAAPAHGAPRQQNDPRGAPPPAHDARRRHGSSTPIRAPHGAGAATSRPPWRAAISAAIARPRPRLPATAARAARELVDRSRQPGPVVDHLDATWRWPTSRAASSTRPGPCSSALATRLETAWARRRRSPWTSAPGSSSPSVT